MPCEACNIQFTVFKRKKSCTECRRLYCSSCLTKNKERILCKRCVIFTTRPLSKIELLKLKAKDLIFYLQSKHISTTGCVEKEELVNLVLIHVDNSSNFGSDSQQSPTSISMGISEQSDDDPRSNPFDQIRNTCQNLFATFTEKIAADFTFDFKQNQSDRPTNVSNVCEDQPRYSNSFGNVPSFNSNVNISNNVTSTASNNGDGIPKPQKPHRSNTMQTSNINQTAQMKSLLVINALENNNTANNSQSTPSILKSISSDDTMTNPSNEQESHSIVRPPSLSPLGASTSNRNKPLICAKITERSKMDCCNNIGSGCECSDDELIAKFRKSYGDQSLSPISPHSIEINAIAIVKTEHCDRLMESTETGNNLLDAAALKGETHENTISIVESLDIASFEDCGAVGGLQSDISPNTNEVDDKWQIINPTWNIDEIASTSSNVVNNSDNNISTTSVSYTTNLPNSITELTFDQMELPNENKKSDNQRHNTHSDEMLTNDTKTTFQQQHSTMMSDSEQQHQQQQQSTGELRSKIEKSLKSRRQLHGITRRQSDGIVYTASTSKLSHRNIRLFDNVDDNSAGANNDDDDDDDEECSTSTSEEVSLHKRTHKSCRKCGKTKGDLRKHIARFRHQLETTTRFSEIEIRQQLDAFLEFLENHSAFDSKMDEVSTMRNTEMIEQSPSEFVAEAIEIEEEEEFVDDDEDYDDEAGIHVYGSNDDTMSTHQPRQFFDLNTIEKKEALEDLSVKQLKEVLMLNRVDFKGCCEKSELLERVQRLWDDLQKCPAVDKLQTVDLCKICMDAAIECVLLECGHMATCTNCGKVLNECPICRQYIVRVVRFFKA